MYISFYHFNKASIISLSYTPLNHNPPLVSKEGRTKTNQQGIKIIDEVWLHCPSYWIFYSTESNLHPSSDY